MKWNTLTFFFFPLFRDQLLTLASGERQQSNQRRGVSHSFIKFTPHFAIFFFISIPIIRRRKVSEVCASEISKQVPFFFFDQKRIQKLVPTFPAAISALELESEEAFLSLYDATKFGALFFWYTHTVQKKDIESLSGTVLQHNRECTPKRILIFLHARRATSICTSSPHH